MCYSTAFQDVTSSSKFSGLDLADTGALGFGDGTSGCCSSFSSSFSILMILGGSNPYRYPTRASSSNVTITCRSDLWDTGGEHENGFFTTISISVLIRNVWICHRKHNIALKISAWQLQRPFVQAVYGGFLYKSLMIFSKYFLVLYNLWFVYHRVKSWNITSISFSIISLVHFQDVRSFWLVYLFLKCVLNMCFKAQTLTSILTSNVTSHINKYHFWT